MTANPFDDIPRVSKNWPLGNRSTEGMVTFQDYRPKDAYHVSAARLTKENAEVIARAVGGQFTFTKSPIDSTETDLQVGLNIPTIHGVVRASEGDMVYKDEIGRWKAVSYGEFNDKYELNTRARN